MIAKQAGDGVAPYTSLDVPRDGADRVFRPTGFYRLRELSLPDVSQDTLYLGLDLPVKRRPLERLDGFEVREFLQKWVERSLVDCKWIHENGVYREGKHGFVCKHPLLTQEGNLKYSSIAWLNHAI